MLSTKVILLAILAGVNCRYLVIEDPTGQFADSLNLEINNGEDLYMEVPFESVHPGYLSHSRTRRQLVQTTTPDGSVNTNLKIPFAGNDKFAVSGLGSHSYDLNQGRVTSMGAGLALDNVNGHGASISGRNIPGFGNQLTAAAHGTAFRSDDHRVGVNAFATRTLPAASVPLPNFNTYGGGVDYMFKDKVGASLGAAHTPLFQKTDYSAMGNLNLFRDRSSSLDLNAGYTKSVSPFINNQSWKPSAGLSFSRSW